MSGPTKAMLEAELEALRDVYANEALRAQAAEQERDERDQVIETLSADLAKSEESRSKLGALVLDQSAKHDRATEFLSVQLSECKADLALAVARVDGAEEISLLKLTIETLTDELGTLPEALLVAQAEAQRAQEMGRQYGLILAANGLLRATIAELEEDIESHECKRPFWRRTR